MLQKNTNFLALDLINIRDNLNNLMEIYNFLDSLADNLKYKKIHKPVLIPYYYGKVANDCGISCYLFINGGYITFHIFEKRKIAYFDIVKDTKIDENKVVELVTKYVESKQYNVYSTNKKNCVLRKNVFGPHYFCKGEMLNNANIDDLLDLQSSIIKEIGMTPIINPVIVKNNNDITLFIAIAESHIAITMRNNSVRIDIFSCKMFDIKVLNEVLNKFITKKEEMVFTRLFKKEQ